MRLSEVFEGKSHQNLFQVIESAIGYCRDNELMKEYFAEHEREVLDMVTFKWDDKRAIAML